jgi:type I restriction enzyme S subunit
MKLSEPRPISDYCVGIYDGPHATPRESPDGAVFLGIRNITDDGRLDLAEIRHVSEEEFPKWTRRVTPQPNDVVFTYEATLHRYAVIPEGFRGCLGRRVALVRPDPKKVDSRYLLYFFLSHEWRKVIEGNVISGATVDRIPLEKFPNFPATLPKLSVQTRVADILSYYDDLIENNRRRMALLEDAALQLYREWFVRLRFPGHEHTRVTNGVPEGWERRRISDIADCVGGGTPSTTVPAYWEDGTITWVTPTDVTRNQHFVLLDGEKKITEAGLKNSSAKLVPPHAVLMTSRASVGFFAIASREVCTNQGFISIVPHAPSFSSFLLFHLSERVDEIRAMGSGSTYPEVSRGKFRDFQVLVPLKRLILDFDEQATLLLKQIRTLKQQNLKLRAARDLLLPRLMSGEIAV